MPGTSIHVGKSTLLLQSITSFRRLLILVGNVGLKYNFFFIVEDDEQKGLSGNVSAPNEAARNSSPLVSNWVTKAVIYSNSLYFLEKPPK